MPFEEGMAYFFAAVQLFAVFCIFFAEYAHIDMKFGVQVYLHNI